MSVVGPLPSGIQLFFLVIDATKKFLFHIHGIKCYQAFLFVIILNANKRKGNGEGLRTDPTYSL